MNEPIQKIYFGARYFDPFFGMWLSPDPAAVFFREVYAPLKWGDFIEKDILQRLNGEAVLLKHSFRASAQFANPYTYGGDPLNYVDPNGEAVHILVGAIIGAVVGTVNGVIQCTSAGGGSCGKSVGVGFVGGAAVGAGAAATGGLAAKAVGGGFAGAVAGGAAGGAVGGAGNYVNQSIVNGGFNSGDLWESTWKGAAAGAVGGGAGEYFGNFRGALVGGFGGGAVGSALNKEDGWSILKSGIMGAAMGGISYAATVHVKANNARQKIAEDVGQSVEGLDDLYEKQLAEESQYGEFELIDGSKNATKMLTYEKEPGVYRNKMNVGDRAGMHGHGPKQDFIGAMSGPSGPDLIAAAQIEASNPDYISSVMDAAAKKIHVYTGKGINLQLSLDQQVLSANQFALTGENIVRTVDYIDYKTSYKSHFFW